MTEFFRRFAPYFKDYIPRFAQAAVGVVLVAATTGALTWLIEDVLDDIFINKDRHALMVLPATIIVLYLIQGLGPLRTDLPVAVDWGGHRPTHSKPTAAAHALL